MDPAAPAASVLTRRKPLNDTPTRVRAMIAKELGVGIDRVVDTAELEKDLKADHIDVVGLVMELEDLFEVTVTDDQMEAARTVADLVALAAPPPPIAAAA